MFDGCKSLKSLPDISKWETASVKDMSYMFHNCWALTSFPDISNWKIYNVKNMSHMFHNCWSLTSFPVLNWDISNVQDMSFMFHNFPLSLIKFQWNFLMSQNTVHMFTNFDNYHNPLFGNKMIYVIIEISGGSPKGAVQAYSDILVIDVIDKYYKIADFKCPFAIRFICNTQSVNLYHTLSKYTSSESIRITGIM